MFSIFSRRFDVRLEIARKQPCSIERRSSQVILSDVHRLMQISINLLYAATVRALERPRARCLTDYLV
jgi:hypothetical protein